MKLPSIDATTGTKDRLQAISVPHAHGSKCSLMSCIDVTGLPKMVAWPSFKCFVFIPWKTLHAYLMM